MKFKIIEKFYEAVSLLSQILEELKHHNRQFDEYKHNLNQIHSR
jgi:hypothetical protein